MNSPCSPDPGGQGITSRAARLVDELKSRRSEEFELKIVKIHHQLLPY